MSRILPAQSQGNIGEQPNNSLQIGGLKQPKRWIVSWKQLVQDESLSVLMTARSGKLEVDD